MSKIGILETKEGKFLGTFVADKMPVNGFWKQGLKMLLPAMINGFDDKFGDQIPEPWQTHLENLTTILYEVLQDGIVDENEIEIVQDLCANIIAEEVDTPLLNGQEEVAAYLFLIKSITSLVLTAFKK